MGNELGVLQEIWDVWDDNHDAIREQTFEHFRQLYEEQLRELVEHRSRMERDKMINEAVDFFSVSMNFLRWLGLGPDEIVEAIHNRVENRYAGKTTAIMTRDSKRFGV